MTTTAVSPLPDAVERVATAIVDGALAGHRKLGPGLLEGIYETCMAYEIEKRELKVDRQVQVPLYYDGARLENELRLDFFGGRLGDRRTQGG